MRTIDPDVLLLSALADPVRLSMVRQLVSSQNVCACDFAECCAVRQPTISHHLKILHAAGVVTRQRQGNNIVYSLAPDFTSRWQRLGSNLAGLTQIN